MAVAATEAVVKVAQKDWALARRPGVCVARRALRQLSAAQSAAASSAAPARRAEVARMLLRIFVSSYAAAAILNSLNNGSCFGMASRSRSIATDNNPERSIGGRNHGERVSYLFILTRRVHGIRGRQAAVPASHFHHKFQVPGFHLPLSPGASMRTISFLVLRGSLRRRRTPAPPPPMRPW